MQRVIIPLDRARMPQAPAQAVDESGAIQIRKPAGHRPGCHRGAQGISLWPARLRDAARQKAEKGAASGKVRRGATPPIRRRPPGLPENQSRTGGAAGRRLISTSPADTSAAAPRIPGPTGSSSRSHPRVSPKTGVRKEKLATPDAG